MDRQVKHLLGQFPGPICHGDTGSRNLDRDRLSRPTVLAFSRERGRGRHTLPTGPVA